MQIFSFKQNFVLPIIFFNIMFYIIFNSRFSYKAFLVYFVVSFFGNKKFKKISQQKLRNLNFFVLRFFKMILSRSILTFILYIRINIK